MEKNNLFRKNCVEENLGPEALDDYIHVTTPAVWLVLAALIILLLGFLTWSIWGTVSIHNADGTTSAVHLISYLIN